jgi:hypothetical protein
LTKTVAAGLAAIVTRKIAGAAQQSSADLKPAVATQSYEEYLKKSAVSRELIDQFIKGPGWAQFDPEVGYILGNSLQHDGVDGSSTLSTVQANGARTSFIYAGRKCRINTYGNSFTQCHQVSDGETWQEYLAAHFGEPIRNFGMGGFGVYQAYRRMVREEKTQMKAEYLILYLWGDDHIRSLFRARWGAIYPWFLSEKSKLMDPHGIGFHSNFWSNVEMDLELGSLVEKEQLLPTPESLYRMMEPQAMVDLLKDDLAVQLSAYSDGNIKDLDRDKIARLAEALGFPFDWSLMSSTVAVPGSLPGWPPKTAMQAQAAALLDRYSLWATQFILDKARAFAGKNGKKLMVVLFDPYRAMNQLRISGTRYDQEIVDYLEREKVDHFDMNKVHLEDYKKFNLSWEDYLKEYFIGHYKPAGNHFFAFALKDKLVPWLDPKPISYQQPDQQTVSFKGYIQGY